MTKTSSNEKGLLLASGSDIFAIDPNTRDSAFLVSQCPAKINGLTMHDDSIWAGGGSFERYGSSGFYGNITKGTYKTAPFEVGKLTSHRGHLYAATTRGNVPPVVDLTTGKVVTDRFGSHLISHNGILYQGSWNGTVFNVLTGEEIVKDAYPLGTTTAFGVHKEKLYHGCGFSNGGVFETLTGKPLVRGFFLVDALVSHNNALCVGGTLEGKALESGVFSLNEETGKLNKITNSRGEHNPVMGLVSHQNELYDLHHNGVYATLNDPDSLVPRWAFPEGAYNTLEVPRQLWEKLVDTRGKKIDPKMHTSTAGRRLERYVNGLVRRVEKMFGS